MKDKQKLISILKIEIEDLRDDVDWLIGEANARAEHGEVSKYVSQENLAFLGHEILDIDGILRLLEGLELDRFGDMDELVQCFSSRLDESLAKHRIMESVHRLLSRKLQKAARYVRETGG